jgi:hypothetical protein
VGVSARAMSKDRPLERALQRMRVLELHRCLWVGGYDDTLVVRVISVFHSSSDRAWVKVACARVRNDSE